MFKCCYLLIGEGRFYGRALYVLFELFSHETHIQRLFLAFIVKVFRCRTEQNTDMIDIRYPLIFTKQPDEAVIVIILFDIKRIFMYGIRIRHTGKYARHINAARYRRRCDSHTEHDQQSKEYRLLLMLFHICKRKSEYLFHINNHAFP